MERDILVSVIMPVYNAEKYLPTNMQSLLKQTYQNIEIILVDDGSKDDSALLMRQYAEEDARVKCLFQENQGAPSARNAGIKISKGEYILLVDSDDQMESSAIETLLRTAVKEEADLVIGQYDTIDEENNHLGDVHFALEADKTYAVHDHYRQLSFLPPLPGNKLYKAQLIREHNLLFAHVKRAQDLNFYLKFLLFADSIAIVNETVYHYRIRTGSISHTISPVILETIKSLNDVEQFYKTHDKYDAKLIQSLKYKYYTDQLSKVPQIADTEIRKQVYKTLVAELKKISKNDLLPEISSKKYIVSNLKIKVPFWYTSNWYSSYQTKKLESVKS